MRLAGLSLGSQPLAHQLSPQAVDGFHRQHIMAIALRIEQSNEFFAFVAKRGARLIGEHQPVVPIADVILQLFQSFADRNRMCVFRRGFGNVAGLLRSFSEVVQAAFIQLLHFVDKPRKGFESHHGSAARATASAPALLNRRFQGACLLVKFCELLRLSLLQLCRMVLARMMEPCIQLLSLVLDRPCRQFGRRSFNHIRGRANDQGLARRRYCSRSFIFAAELDQLVQQLAVHIEIAYRGCGATHLFECAEPLAGRLQQRFVPTLAQDSFDHGLKAARASAYVVHWVNIRIAGALFQIAPKRCRQLAQMLRNCIDGP